MKTLVTTLWVLATVALCTTSTALARSDKRDTTVTRVYANANELLIRLESGTGGEGCTANDWAIIDKSSNSNWEQMFKIATAAYLSGNTVTVRLSGCRYYPRVHYIMMKE